MAYFLITSGEDGGYIQEFDRKETLLNEIKELTDPNIIYPEYKSEFLDELPDNFMDSWPENKYIIIEGKVITPKPVEVVTEWDVAEKTYPKR